MNFCKLIKLMQILAFFLAVGNYAVWAEKTKEGTDKTLADDVKVIRDTDADSAVSNSTTEDGENLKDQGREENIDRPLYEAGNKRDPFKPFVKNPRKKQVVITSATTPPIKRFSLDKYRIVGVVWAGNEPKVVVVDPEKNSYFLGKMDEIGNKNGVIVEVNKNGLLVREEVFFEDEFGNQKMEVKKSVLAFADEDEK